MTMWKEVAMVDTKGKEARTRIVIRDGRPVVVVEVREEDLNVTPECTTALVQSQHSGGYYCSIFHNGKSILALGVDEASKCFMKKGYRIEKARGASVSFRILKTK